MAIAASKPPHGIRIEGVDISFEEFRYRTPYKFGGVPVDRATILNVTCDVRTPDGRTARGFGSMPLGNVWSFPSRAMSYNATLAAMKTLAEQIAKITRNYKEYSHPIETNFVLEDEYLKAAARVSRELKLAAPIPKLSTIVTFSPFDAALHDAYGKALKLSSYRTYTRELMGHDLSRYLNADFQGEELQSYVLTQPRPKIWLFHSVGGADPITDADIQHRLTDGLPETLAEWIRYDGLTHIKIKLQGEDLKWDIDRTVSIDRVARETSPDVDWKLSLDFNERCPNVEYVMEFLRKVKEQSPRGFENIIYVEQPTARDLKADRQNTMHEAAKLRPVVIDESLTDLEALLTAREMGYSGIALKACKGQSQAMLMAAAGQKYKMFLCVQDLTCPGASFVHSAGIAAHIPGVSGIEGNSRQYMPAANRAWEDKFPGLFKIKDGALHFPKADGLGLGVVSL
jgi:L-alanine-DL-glutamate epimerase-like enolase superfamily enzyme